ncbi:OsmC family protein [Pseudobdellovibrio exovorus]|uniref:Redox protein n=1 Tax=Pseudobdellovibrio exovorus JSS TaxID=1184267 RepID=M4V578_9BACT|nr:OsmC family protein [Pseudobdellovibrio exovorus]AGH94343.1 hypothetical protein A11Q_123 [Pseudobdellovibrio exovorus JSS]
MIAAKRAHDLAALIQTATHQFLSGVKEASGGKDEGPDPHEMLEGALAACTIITVQMYANRKQWPLVSTHVKITITSETKESTVIQRDISFEGDLTDEQRQQLFVIANKCPIHRLLHSQIQINSALT